MVEVLIYSLGSAVVGCVILVVALILGGKVLSKKQSSGASGQVKVIEEKIAVIDNAIETALAKFEPLSSASELESLDAKKELVSNNLREIQGKLTTLEGTLSSKQELVNEAETSHNDLKRAKEAAEIMAEEIISKKQVLESEFKALEDELSQSLNQLEVLSTEISLTPQQEAGITKIENALANSQKQLKILIQMYQQGSTRFVNLQSQYKDLEKEFTKLIEKELSG